MYFVLFFLWIVFNGKITFEIIWVGLLISGLIYAFCCKFFGYSIKSEIQFLKNLPLFIKYFGVLLKEIFLANIIVLKIVILGKEIKPVLYHFTTDLKSENSRVLLSHSITLTPGTITVELKDKDFVVHCLDESLANGIENSNFVKILKQIESKKRVK